MRLYGASLVTPYNTVYKVYGLANSIFSTMLSSFLNGIASRILQPLFSAAFKPSFIKIPHFFSKKHLTNQSKNAALRAS